MSKRAEEKSIAYQLATHGPRVMGGDIILSEDDRKFWNINYDFKNGYEEAEKDLALTWEDIKRIVKIADDLIPCTPFVSVSEQIFADEFQTEEAYYKEVLKRFNKSKEEIQ